MNTDTEKQLTFLLVEDDDSHAKIIKRTFDKGSIGNMLERVKDGVEAIQFLNQEGPYKEKSLPHVILLDLNMPKLSGFDVLSMIKTSNEFKHIPVVVLTTSDAESDKNRAYGLSANSYLVKPTEPEDFLKMIESLSLYWGIVNRAVS